MNAWSHLPNACHIDRVFESAKSHPEIWDTAVDTAREASWLAYRDAAYDAAYGAALGVDRYAAWVAARDAAIALIAYDDASKYLEMASDQLRVWAILSEEPAAILLLPAVIAFERINELELV